MGLSVFGRVDIWGALFLSIFMQVPDIHLDMKHTSWGA